MSLRKIAEETGHHFETVQKYANQENFNLQVKAKQKRKSKLDSFKEQIDKWLLEDTITWHKQRHTTQRIYNRLVEIHGQNFNVSDRAVRKYVAQRRKELSRNTDGFLPLEHQPGEAQVDFGEARFVEKGITYEGYYLTLSFPYSNGGYIQLFKSQNQECLLEGLKAIFEYIGGSPREIWFDNASTIVKEIQRDGGRDLNKGFQRFMLHYNFLSNFCNPNSGHEKGHIENKVGYTRRNLLVPVPEFEDIREYNRNLLEKCDTDMHRKHYKKAKSIAALFEEDKKALCLLPSIPFEVYRLELVKGDNYGKVKFDNKIYSSSPAFAGRQLWLKAGAHEVTLLDENYREIAKHDRLYGPQKESMKWGPYLELMARRPNALKYSGFFRELPLPLKDYLEQCDIIARKAVLKVLAKMVKKSDLETDTNYYDCLLKGGGH